jgi:hypothetical protein
MRLSIAAGCKENFFSGGACFERISWKDPLSSGCALLKWQKEPGFSPGLAMGFCRVNLNANNSGRGVPEGVWPRPANIC